MGRYKTPNNLAAPFLHVINTTLVSHPVHANEEWPHNEECRAKLLFVVEPSSNLHRKYEDNSYRRGDLQE